MPQKDLRKTQRQLRLFSNKLSEELNPKNKLYKLKELIDWQVLENYVVSNTEISAYGRERHSARVLLGLLMLQAMHNTSDRLTSEELTENIYWQYFCGYEYMEKEVGVSESSIRRFRQQLGQEGLNEILKELVRVGVRTGAVKKKDLTTTIIDTTVQNKNIKHPHDAVLMGRARENLIKLFSAFDIKLNDTYAKFFKFRTLKLWRYRHDSKAKKRMKIMKSMKTRLGRLIRLFERISEGKGIILNQSQQNLFQNIKKIHRQSALSASEKKSYKQENQVLYSLHAPEAECIGKGKLHKPYEFGNKVGVAVSGRGNFVLSAQSFHGNPYDGHTLKDSIEGVQEMTGQQVQKVFADRGYRGNNFKHKSKVYLPGSKKQLTFADRKMQKRRSAIEPIIGHLKYYGRMARNYLRGVIGDILNPVISAIGVNLRNLGNYLTASRSFSP